MVLKTVDMKEIIYEAYAVWQMKLWVNLRNTNIQGKGTASRIRAEMNRNRTESEEILYVTSGK